MMNPLQGRRNSVRRCVAAGFDLFAVSQDLSKHLIQKWDTLCSDLQNSIVRKRK